MTQDTYTVMLERLRTLLATPKLSQADVTAINELAAKALTQSARNLTASEKAAIVRLYEQHFRRTDAKPL